MLTTHHILLLAVPDNYRCAYENRTITADRAFYVPGAEEASWNKVGSMCKRGQALLHPMCKHDPAAWQRLRAMWLYSEN